MKQNIFSKKNQLDEMQEQTLRKIESHGFWLMWWGLFAVIIFQLMMQADISQMAGEWIVFMAACLYTLEECLRNGIWDRHIKASLSTSIVGSLVGSVLSSIEPVGSVVISVLFLHTAFTWLDLLGFSLILVTIPLMAIGKAREQ